MKFRLLAMLTLLCGSGATLFGQDLEGAWQGTLKTPAAQLRVVFKITKAADGKFAGQGFSIDQNGQPIPMNSISVDGRTVKWKLDALNASYDGPSKSFGRSLSTQIP